MTGLALMPKTTRTFVAFGIPATLGERLARLQTQLAAQIPEVRWSETRPFHLTLAFLGDVADVDLNPVCKAVSAASGPFAPFTMRIEGVGAFPSPARPRVLWAGLTAAKSTVFELQKAIVQALSAVGYRPEDQRFTPHTTLGRIKSDRRDPLAHDLTSILKPLQSWSGGEFQVNEVITYASTLSKAGPVYAPLARAPLTGKNQTGSP